jgi:hypothetical protein
MHEDDQLEETGTITSKHNRSPRSFSSETGQTLDFFPTGTVMRAAKNRGGSEISISATYGQCFRSADRKEDR